MRVLHNTHVLKISIHRGLQWALHKATVVFLYEYEGPLYSLVMNPSIESIII